MLGTNALSYLFTEPYYYFRIGFQELGASATLSLGIGADLT